MKIDTFLTLLKNKKNEDSRVELISSHVKNRYVPLEEKQARAKSIIESSYYQKTNDGRQEFHVNSVAKYMLTGLTMMDMYTDIEVEKNNGKSLENFNKLNEARVLDDVLSVIDGKEWSEFVSVLDMEEEDVIKNEYEPRAFVRNQFERFGNLIGTSLLPVLENLDISQIEELVKKYVK